MKFTQIPNELTYPPMLRSRLSTIHSDIVNWVANNFDGTYNQRRNIVSVMNSVSYMMLSRDTLPQGWDSANPLVDPPHIDDDLCSRYLNKIYIHEKSLVWDVEIKQDPSSESLKTEKNIYVTGKTSKSQDILVDKSDLFIQPPSVPSFDKDSIWMSGMVDDDYFVIYRSLPLIPVKQNQISVTTDINSMTDKDFMKLFPPDFIRTRPECMYEPVYGLDYDDRYGVIIKIDGFTKEQVLTNIIEYPHLYKLMKWVDGIQTNFYRTIEIDGELHDISEIWHDLPECSVIPYTPDFIKEYVVRRYLLERDIKHIKHRYELVGDLSKFLTLFMPSDMYEDLGYEPHEIARKCVSSRISYKQSRNPIIRRLNNA